MRFPAAYLLLYSCGVMVVCATSSTTPLSNRSQLPFFDAEEMVEVHMLEKHVYNQQDVNVTNTSTTRFLAHLNDFVPLFHVSLGLRARPSGKEVALEYIAKHGLGPAVAPVVEPNGTLSWHNEGQMLVDSTISAKRWERAMLVAVINSTAYNRLADWAVKQAREVTSYNLFSVVEKPGGHAYLADNTCSTMPWRAFGFLRDSLGCTVAPLVPPQRNIVTFITAGKPPEKVDMGVEEQRKAVVSWFKHIDFNLIDAFFNPAFGTLRRNPQAFVYVEGEYWRLHLAKPFTSFSYTPDASWLGPS